MFIHWKASLPVSGQRTSKCGIRENLILFNKCEKNQPQFTACEKCRLQTIVITITIIAYRELTENKPKLTVVLLMFSLGQFLAR